MVTASKTRPASRWRFQFSLRLLFIATAVVAVLTAIGISEYRERVLNTRPRLFTEAIRTGNLAETDRLLKIDPRLAHGREHGRYSSSWTPLQQALVIRGNAPVISRLLEENPDLNDTTTNGETALHLVVNGQLISEVARLLKLGADPNCVDDDGMTPLHLAARLKDQGQTLALLLKSGANVNPIQTSTPHLVGKSPLHFAVEVGNKLAVAQLLKAGANVNSSDSKGQTALHFALARDDDELTELLIEGGADLTAKDHTGRIPGQTNEGSNSATTLMIWWKKIVQLHDQNMIGQLDKMLDAAPQVLSFRSDNSQATLVHLAGAKGRLDVLIYLLKRGMDPDVRDRNGKTPLHYACLANSSTDLMELLLEVGSDIEARDEFGCTPLHSAALAHNLEGLEFLIANGADIDALDEAAISVLDTAFERPFDSSANHKTVELLRQAGHAPTVLYAVATGDIELLQRLTDGNPKLLDRRYTCSGVYPLYAALLGRQFKVVEWLVDRGAELNPIQPTNKANGHVDTPLMVALGYNVENIAILLINRGADVNRKSVTGYYPAHAVIAWDRDPMILEALLTHGADPALKHENQTAVELATASKSKHRGRYLKLLSAVGHDR